MSTLFHPLRVRSIEPDTADAVIVSFDVPGESPFRSTGKRGIHTEHMGYILTELQHLQRAYPGGVW